MLKKIDDMNFYELLEVSPRATAQEIHKAYERVRRIYDPNSIALYSLFSPEETEKIRQRVEEAYRTLVYEENRRDYDLRLRQTPEFAECEQPVPQRQARTVPMATPVAAPPLPAEPAPSPQRPVCPGPPPQQTTQPAPESIAEFTGPVIKMLREQKGLTVQGVADVIKVSSRHLAHIEEEAFPKLPARPYLRGFLILYAKGLGYEPERIVGDYMKRYDAAMNPPKKKPA